MSFSGSSSSDACWQSSIQCDSFMARFLSHWRLSRVRHHPARAKPREPRKGNTVSRFRVLLCNRYRSARCMPPPNLEDRIRLLTDRAIAAKSQSELDAILPERNLLSETTEPRKFGPSSLYNSRSIRIAEQRSRLIWSWQPFPIPMKESVRTPQSRYPNQSLSTATVGSSDAGD